MRTTDKPIVTDISAAIARQQESKKILRRAIGSISPRPTKDAKRLTKAQELAVREYMLDELRACYRAVSDKLRENPEWHRGYNSALSVIETRIALVRDGKPCACAQTAGCTERCDRKESETSDFQKFLAQND